MVGFSPGAAGRQLIALLAAFALGPGIYGICASRRLSPWGCLVVMAVVGLLAFVVVTRLQTSGRRWRGLPPDSAIAVSVTHRRVVVASDGASPGAVVVRDRPRDELVGISLQQRPLLLMPRRLTLVRLHFSDGSTDALGIGGGSLDGLRASLRLAGIAELDPSGTPTPPVGRTAHADARVTVSTSGPRLVLCAVLSVWGMSSFYLGALIGHQVDPWAGSGFTSAHAHECARQAVELLDPGAMNVRFRTPTSSEVDGQSVLLAAAEVQSADGTTESVRFVCTSDLGRITATRFD